jgi:ABC-2 type transport system permease protein
MLEEKMRNFLLFFRHFLRQAFSGPWAYVLHFVLPLIGFLGMYLLLSLSESKSFAGSQAVGLVLYLSMIQAAVVVSLTLRDREQGVMSRIVASPASRLSYVLGNGAAAFAVLAAQAGLFTLFLAFAFRAPVGTGFIGLIATLLCFNVSSVGLAFLICALCDSSAAAVMVANVAILFSGLMGGVFFPVEFMGGAMRAMAVAFPQYWAMKALRQMRAAAPWMESGSSLLILLLFGALFIAVQGAVNRRKRLYA